VFLYLAPADDPAARAYFEPSVVRSAARTRLGLAGDREPPPPAWAERRAVRTGEAGEYAFEGVAPGRAGEVVVRAPDAETASAKVVVESADVRRDFALAPRPEIRLRLVDERGEPLEGVRVALYLRATYEEGAVVPFGWTAGEGGDGEPPAAVELVRPRAGGASVVTVRVLARTDARGAARWRPLRRGAWRVTAHAGGRAPFVADGLAPDGQDDAWDLDLGEVLLARAPPEAPRARLVERDGTPLRGRVVALTTADEFQSEVPGPEGDGLRRTDDDGWFSLEHCVGGGEHHVWVHPVSPERRVRRVHARLEPGIAVVVPGEGG
jgi:hypothetical protein